ncbi:MAG: DUF123 domain-containing protein [Anaerolineae bacterium]|nr:DUF123 domain-containing protein [Anaerolineae bacterium]
MTETPLEPVVVIGSSAIPTGTYVLRIRVDDDLPLVFGRFKGGKTIVIPAGECVYVGSAMGRRGAVTLSRRLIRHATRTDPLPPHEIRSYVLSVLADQGDALPRRPKTLFWNVDYLLNALAVELTQIVVIHSERRLESAVAARLSDSPFTMVIEAGIGAGDAPGATHLLRWNGTAAAWQDILAGLRVLDR